MLFLSLHHICYLHVTPEDCEYKSISKDNSWSAKTNQSENYHSCIFRPMRESHLFEPPLRMLLTPFCQLTTKFRSSTQHI